MNTNTTPTDPGTSDQVGKSNEKSVENTETQNPQETGITAENKKQDPFKLYPMRYSKFMSFYLGIVILSCAGFLIAVFAAIEKDLLWVACIAAVTLFCYIRFTSNEMREKLGLTYKTGVSTLEITSCRPKYGDILFIPSKLLWYDVESIADEAFKPKRNSELKEIYLPSSLKKIGKNILLSCENLEAIRFCGSEDEWNAIEKETDFDGITITFNESYPEIPKKQSKQNAKK